jgi:hypothetical protein
MSESSNPFFAEPAYILATLREKDAQRPPRMKTPYGSFSSFSRPDGEDSLQGYVWTNTWVVGVWATVGASDKIREAVFWTCVDDARPVDIKEHPTVSWTRSELVAHAAAWFGE